jgi:4-carboxymuconolactone decarboxylase
MTHDRSIPVTKPSDVLGGRLPLVDPSALTPEQRKRFDSVIANQLPWAKDSGFEISTEDGRLIGPFNTFLRHPEIACGSWNSRPRSRDTRH